MRLSRLLAFVSAVVLVATLASSAPAGAQDTAQISHASSTITTNTDTAVVAAGGAGVQFHVLRVCVDVYSAGTASTVRIEDGASGAVIFAADTSSTGNWCRDFTGFQDPVTGVASFGRPMTANTAINAETAGSAAASAAVTVVYRR